MLHKRRLFSRRIVECGGGSFQMRQKIWHFEPSTAIMRYVTRSAFERGSMSLIQFPCSLPSECQPWSRPSSTSRSEANSLCREDRPIHDCTRCFSALTPRDPLLFGQQSRRRNPDVLTALPSTAAAAMAAAFIHTLGRQTPESPLSSMWYKVA